MNWYKKIKEAQMEKEKKLIILRGPPGSGKSFLVKQIIQEYGNAYVFSADDFFRQNPVGEYMFDMSKLGMAHEWNRQRAKEAMEKGLSPVIIDNTNIKAKEFSFYLKVGREYGYDMEIKEPNWGTIRNPDGTWNAETLIKNQENSDRDKKVPPERIEKAVNKYQYDLTPEKVLEMDKPKQ